MAEIDQFSSTDDYLSPLFGHQAACQARHGKMRTFAVREVAARQDRGSDHDDILGKLSAIHQQKPDQFDEAGVISVSLINRNDSRLDFCR